MKSPLPSKQRWVPVVSSTGLPLMPCRPVRARKLVQRGRAVKRWKNRLFYSQARRNQALLRSSLQGRNFLPAMNGGVPSSLYGEK